MSEPREDRPPIGENTTIRVSLIVVFAGFLAGATWWAASMQTKVDTLLTNGAKFDASATAQGQALIELGNRLTLIDQVGTKKTHEMERDLGMLTLRVGVIEARLPPIAK